MASLDEGINVWSCGLVVPNRAPRCITRCVSVLGPPVAPSLLSLFHGVTLPWLPEELPGYPQGHGWGFLVRIFFLFYFRKACLGNSRM